MTTRKTPHSSKFVMTFAEYCAYQRERERAIHPCSRNRIGVVAELKRLTLILEHAEVINPFEPTKKQ